MSRRLDKRRAIIPAVVFATLVLGYGAYRLGGSAGDVPAHPSGDPHFVNAASLERDDATLHQAFQASVALLQTGEYEYAVKGFHDVLRIAPEMPEAHANMGFALLGLGKYVEARDFFNAAAGLRPSQINAYYGLAIAHEGLGELREAVTVMRAYTHLAVEGDPFRRKAEAAIWEWEAALAATKQ